MSLTAQQLEDRKHNIGGSDVAAIMGLSPWKTPVEIWKEKTTGVSTFKETEASRMGHVLEPVVADLFAQRHPEFKVFEQEEETVFHPKHKCMIAHADRLLSCNPGLGGILEIKTSRYGWEALPAYYELQVRHYMAVMNLDYAYVAALFGGSEYWECRVERDSTMERVIIKHCLAFYESLSLPTCPYDAENMEDLAILFPVNETETTYIADAEFMNILSRYRDVTADLKMIEDNQKKLKVLIGNKIAGCRKAVDGAGRSLVSFPEVKGRDGFDHKRLLEDDPDTHAKYATKGLPYRRMTVLKEKS